MFCVLVIEFVLGWCTLAQYQVGMHAATKNVVKIDFRSLSLSISPSLSLRHGHLELNLREKLNFDEHRIKSAYNQQCPCESLWPPPMWVHLCVVRATRWRKANEVWLSRNKIYHYIEYSKWKCVCFLLALPLPLSLSLACVHTICMGCVLLALQC